MPVYVYQCQQCGGRQEHTHGLNERFFASCQQCGGLMEKAFNPSVVLKTPSASFPQDESTPETLSSVCAQGHHNCSGHQLAEALMAQENTHTHSEDSAAHPGPKPQS